MNMNKQFPIAKIISRVCVEHSWRTISCTSMVLWRSISGRRQYPISGPLPRQQRNRCSCTKLSSQCYRFVYILRFIYKAGQMSTIMCWQAKWCFGHDCRNFIKNLSASLSDSSRQFKINRLMKKYWTIRTVTMLDASKSG